jgi:hypothetical protein
MGRAGRKEIKISEVREHQNRFNDAATRLKKALAKLKMLGKSGDFTIRVESMIDKLEKAAKNGVKAAINVENAVDDLVNKADADAKKE